MSRGISETTVGKKNVHLNFRQIGVKSFKILTYFYTDSEV